MSSRDRILNAVRAQQLAPQPLPDLQQAWITYPDRRRQFAEVLQSVGGQCEFVTSLADIPARLAENAHYTTAKKIVSLAPEIIPGNLDLATVVDPHELEDVDFALARGHFGVAENGAIWVFDPLQRHRAIYFITQHLSLVISAANLVDNMHQAYERLHLGEPQYGVFISGPSKTADIEQSLVIGAHGPRSLTVFCVG